MRIAFVIFKAEPQRGGAERYAIDLATHLSARGHELAIVSTRFGDVGSIRKVPVRASAVTRTGVYRAFLSRVDDHLHAHTYDIVHTFLPIRTCDVYHAQAGLETISLATGHAIKSTAVKRTVTRVSHLANRKRKAFADVERHLIEGPRPPITIVLSKREREIALTKFKVDPARIVALYNGIDTSRFEPNDLAERRRAMRKSLGIAADRPLALFIGNDFARKGLDTAIRALAKLPDRHATLLVVGSDAPRSTRSLRPRWAWWGVCCLRAEVIA
ncbi:MAG: glycosyltransferase family 4 protein [Tepidisphaeraceae bacterium]